MSFTTGHKVQHSNDDWQEAQTKPVIYMGLVGLETILGHLMTVGREATPAALVENATLPEQREICTAE